MASNSPNLDTNRPDPQTGEIRDDQSQGPICATSMKLNATVGVVASAIGFGAIYVAWQYFAG